MLLSCPSWAQFAILLPQPPKVPKSWDHRYLPQCPAVSWLSINHTSGFSGSSHPWEVTSNSNFELPKFVLCFCQKLSGLMIRAMWMQQGKDSCRIFSRGLMESHLDPRMSTITVKPRLHTSSLQRRTQAEGTVAALPQGLLSVPWWVRCCFLHPVSCSLGTKPSPDLGNSALPPPWAARFHPSPPWYHQKQKQTTYASVTDSHVQLQKPLQFKFYAYHFESCLFFIQEENSHLVHISCL